MFKRAHLIANHKSGKGLGASLPEIAKKVCDELGAELVHYKINDPKELDQKTEEAVQAAESDGGVVIAAGGDGTIRGVAQHAVGRKVNFAAVGCGTFNFFARNHRIPEDVTEAFRLALTGNTRPVRLGEVNGNVFLINASLGLYAKAIREREHATSRFGRHRLVVIISSILSFLSGHRLLKVDLATGGDIKHVHTPMIFIGNNALQLRNLKMDVASCMKSDLLAAVILKPVGKLETLRIIWRGILKTLERDDHLQSFCVENLTIYTRRPSHHVALDGEMFVMNSPFKIKALPGALNMVTPP